MTAKTSIHVTVKGPGIAIERDVPVELATDLMRLLFGNDASTDTERPASAGRASTAAAPSGTLAEFFQQAEPKRNPDKIAAAAAYYRAKGRTSVTREELSQIFRLAGEAEPKNFARDMRWAVKAGWIGGNDGDGFYVTNTGQAAVTAKFPKEMLERTKQPGRARRTKAPKKG